MKRNIMNNISKFLLFVLVTFVVPVYSFAQTGVPGAIEGTPIGIFTERLGAWVGFTTPVVVALALLVFIWGIVRFISHGGDEEKRKEGKKFIGWSIVAIFVMVSIWGIIRFIEISIYPGRSGTVRQSLPAPCLSGVPGSDCGKTPDG